MGRTPVFVASLSVTASRMLIRRTCPFVTGFCGCHNCSSSSIVRLSWDIEGWRLASADFSGFVESYSYLCFLSRGAKRKNKESERASRCVYWSIYISTNPRLCAGPPTHFMKKRFGPPFMVLIPSVLLKE
jgi:hypothetical protein